MASRDLREWLKLLETEGELKRIKAEVGWDGEMSQICKKVYAQAGPALLFENIRDHAATVSTRLFTNGIGTPARWNLMLGLPKDTAHATTIRTIRDRIVKPLPPVTVASGPVKENIIRGADVDLFQFPISISHLLCCKVSSSLQC